MSRHTGKNGVCKLAGGALADLRGFDITEGVGTVDLTAAGDSGDDHDTLTSNWSGTIDVLYNSDDPAQSVRAGDVVSFSGATEGDAVGREEVSGSCTVESVGRSMTYNGEVTKSLSIKGKGVLAVGVIS